MKYSDYMSLSGFGAYRDVTAADAIGAATATAEQSAGNSAVHSIMIGVVTGVLIHFASKFVDKVMK